MYSRVPNKEEISVVQDTLMAATVTITTTTTTIKMPEWTSPHFEITSVLNIEWIYPETITK